MLKSMWELTKIDCTNMHRRKNHSAWCKKRQGCDLILPLSINCAQGNSPQVRAEFSKLGNVVCDLKERQVKWEYEHSSWSPVFASAKVLIGEPHSSDDMQKQDRRLNTQLQTHACSTQKKFIYKSKSWLFDNDHHLDIISWYLFRILLAQFKIISELRLVKTMFT